MMKKQPKLDFTMTRRNFLRVSGALSATALLAACGGAGGGAGRTIKIGIVGPITGPLAGFGEADEFVLESVREIFGDGIEIDGTTYPIEIILKDSESDPNRAAQVAQELILNEEVEKKNIYNCCFNNQTDIII